MCGCEPGRSFLTKDERIERLNEYKESIDKESEGIAEKIERIKKG